MRQASRAALMCAFVRMGVRRPLASFTNMCWRRHVVGFGADRCAASLSSDKIASRCVLRCALWASSLTRRLAPPPLDHGQMRAFTQGGPDM